MSPGIEKRIKLAQQRMSRAWGDRREYLIKAGTLLAGGGGPAEGKGQLSPEECRWQQEAPGGRECWWRDAERGASGRGE